MRVALLNFEGDPGVPLLKFEGGPGSPLLNLQGAPGSRVPEPRGPGPTFTPCGHQRCSIKKVVFKNLAIFTRKHLCWSLFLIDSNTCVFL